MPWLQHVIRHTGDQIEMERREALTIRVPGSLLAQARSVKQERESLNDLIVTAVDREVRRREGLRTVHEIVAFREQMARESGNHADSTALIRSLREGNERYGG